MAVEIKRHILKSITWRIVASVTTFIIAWLSTGNINAGLSIGLFDFFLKFILYFLHERAWYKTKYGIKQQDSSKG